ncbi:glycoside hydrolase family 55 protein [Ustulina deusta]|nr:glycoside hydrolase family 55 protein [Ustulina deusta]
MVVLKALGLLVLGFPLQLASAQWKNPDPNRFPNLPSPQPNPPYMVDNQHNYFKTAPDKGKQNGPTWPYSGSFDKYIRNLQSGRIIRGGIGSGGDSNRNGSTTLSNSTLVTGNGTSNGPFQAAASSSYWLAELGPMGSQPLAGSGYKFYRDVVADYQADNTGGSDASEAINAAIVDGKRCGEECGNTFTQGAIVYFPPGTYMICSPIIQYYYTQFIGDATSPPTIKGCNKFSGIALIDTDPYIPGGAGAEWYINQNQFFRHIRNFIFDLTDMPVSTNDDHQTFVPTGMHWQVSQATTLQNLVFNMPAAAQNGSGATFNGGAIGWRAGSQQYTARNLKFKDCLTAVQMVWDWGFNWQGVDIQGGAIGFNISGHGGDTGQGTGSVSIIDSSLSGVPVGILTSKLNNAPNIVLDNVNINNVAQVVQQDGGSTLLSGSGASQNIKLWGVGQRYNGEQGGFQMGDITAPAKATSLLANGKLFVRSRPQYETLGSGSFLVATQNGIANDGTGDQTNAINTFLQKAQAGGRIAYFPAGIYQVGGTVYIPTGSRVQGSSWSQIQGAGSYFSDMNNPKVMVQVGNKGEVGDMEIVEMLFTVRGPTAGAILMEWNVAAKSQGSAAMWDSHFRVGGGTGTDLDSKKCPKGGFNEDCIAASLMFHVTQQANGYFENVWAWVADHDNDVSVYDSPDKLINQISIYGARGMLIESQGPSWFYGSGSEHSVLYNYQLYNAKDVYLGHIQTETPYYQPNPVAPFPFQSAKSMAGDPSFADCTTDACKATWGLRVVDSADITVHSAGLYSFFQDYYQDCVDTKDCQERILEVIGSTGVVIFNLFTVATSQIANGIDKSVILGKDVQSGFTTEVSVWIPLPGQDNINIIYVGTEIWSSPTVTCSPPCILVLPTSHLSSSTTIDPGNYTTSFEYGHLGVSTNSLGQVTTLFTTVITTVTIHIPPITTDGIPYSNVNVTGSRTDGGFVASPSVSISPIGVPLPNGDGGTTTRTVQLPPWPGLTNGPPTDSGSSDPFSTIPSTTGSGTYYSPISTTITATKATVTTITFPGTVGQTTVNCPPQSEVTFVQPRTTVNLICSTPTAFTFHFDCSSTKVVTFLASSTGVFTQYCSLTTVFPTQTQPPGGGSSGSSSPTSTTTTPIPIWTTWPPGLIVPETTSVEDPRPTDDGVVIPCHLWFFNICIGGIIGGWHIILPPGIYPPGPPPFIQWPTPLATIEPLPPWPKITIGPNNQFDYDDEPEESCMTQTASVCSTTLFVTATVTGGTTTTTTSTSTGGCETVEGCSATNSNTVTSTTTTEACTPTSSGSSLNVCNNDALVYPQDPSNVDAILSLLSAYSGKYQQVEGGGETAFIWVPTLDQKTFDTLKASSAVYDVQYYEQYNKAVPDNDDDDEISTDPPDVDLKRRNATMSYDAAQDQSIDDSKHLLRRDAAAPANSRFWQRSLNSLAKGAVWRQDGAASYDRTNNVEPYQYWYDNAAGFDTGKNQGYNVYIINEAWVYSGHPEWQGGGGGTIELLSPGWTFNAPTAPTPDNTHGTGVAAQINGRQLGTCKRCHVVWFQTQQWQGYPDYGIRSQFLVHLYAAYGDIIAKGLRGKAVINMSFTSSDRITPAALRAFKYMLDKLDKEQNVVLVAAAGNGAQTQGKEIDRYPARFGSPSASRNPFGQIKNMIIVGATNGKGEEASFSQNANYLTTYAPGQQIWIPTNPNNADPWVSSQGTSFAAPAVAGIAAYIRSLDSPFKTQLENPANVKKMITFLAHRYDRQKKDNSGLEPINAADKRPVAWNGQVQNTVQGQVQSHSCLADYDTIAQWDINGACDGINSDMSQMGTGESTGSCNGPSANPKVAGRDDGGSCPLPGPGAEAGGTSITFTSGAKPSPTCATAAGCGGTVCSGYYCSPTQTSGPPPDFYDPKDPNNGNPVPTTTVGSPSSSSTTTTTTIVSTTTSSTPPPAPTEELRILFDFMSATDGGGDPPAFGAAFKWYEVRNGDGLELCQQLAVYETLVDSGLNDPGWPPTDDPDTDIFGRSGCHYTGNDNGAGQFECDGVPRFQCTVDPQSDQQIECDDVFTTDTYIPRVRCAIPR